MGKVVRLPLPRSRLAGLAARAQLGPADAGRDLDRELLPIAGLLFVASLARVLHAVWRQEAFDVEPTVALIFVIGLPWLTFRSLRRHRETRGLTS